MFCSVLWDSTQNRKRQNGGNFEFLTISVNSNVVPEIIGLISLTNKDILVKIRFSPVFLVYLHIYLRILILHALVHGRSKT